MQDIRFKVAPYALFDVLCALQCSSDKNSSVVYSVTKEDGELWVNASRVYKTEIASTDGMADGNFGAPSVVLEGFNESTLMQFSVPCPECEE